MFDLLKDCSMNSPLFELFLKSIRQLEDNIKQYFPSLDVSSMDWVRDPFIECAYESAVLNNDEESELIDIRNDRGLKLQYGKRVEEQRWSQD
jgi:hypothetical protein